MAGAIGVVASKGMSAADACGVSGTAAGRAAAKRCVRPAVLAFVLGHAPAGRALGPGAGGILF